MGKSSTPPRSVRPTIIDVAQRAGVSFKTVSRVLNGEQNVRPKTKEKVLKAAKELDFRINQSARSLRSGRSHLIGLFFHNASRSYVSDIQAGAMRQCRKIGYHLIVEDDVTSAEGVTALLHETRLAGVVLTPPLSDNIEIMTLLDDKQIPFVRIEKAAAYASAQRDMAVGIANEDAAFDMTNYLIAKGHQRIGFISGNRTYAVSAMRQAGYERALKTAGLPVDKALIRRGDFSHDSALKPAEKLLGLEHRPTAIFASNDDMAAAVLAKAAEQGLKVPADISVAGFDDTPTASVVYPRLTTIRQPIMDLAAEAVGMLTASPSGDAQEDAIALRLPYKLVLRESVGSM